MCLVSPSRRWTWLIPSSGRAVAGCWASASRQVFEPAWERCALFAGETLERDEQRARDRPMWPRPVLQLDPVHQHVQASVDPNTDAAHEPAVAQNEPVFDAATDVIHLAGLDERETFVELTQITSSPTHKGYRPISERETIQQHDDVAVDEILVDRFGHRERRRVLHVVAH